jgi:signal transduction histidine kinase
MKIPAFAKTIRFRLTIWYVGLLLLFIVIFIIGLNVTMSNTVSAIQRAEDPVAGRPLTQVEIVQLVRSENLELLRNYSLIGIASLLILAAGGSYLLSGRMLKPVDHVASLAARISSTNLKERINRQGPDDEVKRLADTFDDMLERLESAFESQKQFIQDASHELRTPIAIAQANIEVAEMEGKATARDYRRLMEVLKMSLERLNRLSDNLLLLSNGEQPQTKQMVVDLSPLLNEVVAEAGARAEAADVKLELEPMPDDIRTSGDAFRLKQAIINLLDNAIKYNRPGGNVRVSADADESQLAIRVQDSGIGIPHGDRQRIFDRFYRVDKSRSRAQGGSGLGLAIVKKIVEDHGGGIAVESTPDAGSTFTITLPRHRLS